MDLRLGMEAQVTLVRILTDKSGFRSKEVIPSELGTLPVNETMRRQA